MEVIQGFSKLNKQEKINWLANQYKDADAIEIKRLAEYWHQSPEQQKIIDDFSENTLSNFYIPFSLAPNFLINEELYSVPMAIEESSVVAAASKAAKFWLTRGGFKTKVLSNTKKGHVHLNYPGSFEKLASVFHANKEMLIKKLQSLESNMRVRGGGVLDIELFDYTDKLENYYAIELKANTCDAMGANFINSLLEKLGSDFKSILPEVEIVMAILTNYNDECLVQAEVNCSIEELDNLAPNMNGMEFAQKFKRAVDIAIVNPKRAVTHNKGIFNGIDALVLATGNDFRATSAAGHAYASRSGEYQSLSTCEINDGIFKLSLTLPLALGTVGGLTKLHPVAKQALLILKRPNANKLMEICAALGLAQNFAAIRSLVTTGIQKGHMKMHLLNILNQLEASEQEVLQVKEYFQNKVISFSEVATYLQSLRSIQ